MSKFLFDFVQSLTKREKVYFKSFSSFHNKRANKNYLELYEVFQKAEKYDPELLKKQLTKPQLKKHFTSECSYLLEQLLRSITNFHVEGNLEMKLQKRILQIKLLLDKKYQKQSLKMLNKTKKLAMEMEAFSVMLQLIKLEEDILFKTGIMGFTKKLAELQTQREEITRTIKNLNQLRLLREQVRELAYSNITDLSSEQRQYYFKNPLLKNQANALSKKALVHWLYAKGILNYLQLHPEKALQLGIEELKLIKSNPSIFKKSDRLVPMSNSLWICAVIGEEALFTDLSNQLKILSNDPQIDTTYVTFIRLSRGIEYLVRNKEHPLLKNTLEETLDFLKERIAQIGPTQQNYLLTIVGCYCLKLKQYNQALIILEKLNSLKVLEVFLIPARVFLLMIQYEYKWNSLVLSNVESSYKIFTRHKCLNDLSKCLLKFFKSSVKYPHRTKNQLKTLVQKLEKLKKEPKYQIEFDLFDYHEWALNKLVDYN